MMEKTYRLLPEVESLVSFETFEGGGRKLGLVLQETEFYVNCKFCSMIWREIEESLGYE